MIDWLYELPLRVGIANFLQIQLFNGFDLWFLVHFMSGLIIFYYFNKKQDLVNSLFYTLAILVAFESLELSFFMQNNRFFIPETFMNQILDLVVGMLGAISYKISKSLIKK